MIGIVTISFNQAAFLSAAIDSVVATSLRDKVKYVVVDAGSTDGSRELLSKRSTDIDLIICEPDKGPADGLNKGFANCTDCEIFGYLNSDDRLAPGALEWVLNFFKRNQDIDVLLGAIAMIDSAGHRSKRCRVSDPVDLRRYAIGACNIFQQGTFFRSSAFRRTQGFNVENRTCWDAELIVDMTLKGARVKPVRKVLGEFRMHAASITGSGRLNQKYVSDRLRIMRKINAAGFRPYSDWHARLVRTLHRLSPSRHISYLLAS
jgi:glycosyltransferase involved in cell wall biosynthesis